MTERDDTPERMTRTGGFALAAILLVHFIVRFCNVPHLLAWDEAMNIRTVVSHVTGANNQYAVWFSRHPPMLATMLTMLRPLEDGFAVRAELLAIAISCGTLLVLFAVAKETFGTRCALFSAACYAVMPAAVFYDVWIKQDGLVAFSGLIAIFFWLRGRALFAGMFLGVCCLAKENAVYFAGALFLLWLFDRPWKIRNLAAIVIAPVLIAGWWYVFFSTAVADQVSFATGVQIHKVEQWDKPVFYFFQKLPLDLGWPGLVLATAGIVICIAARRGGRTAGKFWPLALLVPGYALITLMHGKAPWLNIALLPAIAVVQGIACETIASRLERNLRGFFAALAKDFAPLLLAVVAMDFVVKTDYEEFMQRQDYGSWRGANASRAAARELKKRMKTGESLLVTPMWYWTGEQQVVCPIFLTYFGHRETRGPMRISLAPNTVTATELLGIVREKRIDWVLLAPPPGGGEKNLLAPLIREHHLTPIVPDGKMNCIFDVRPLRSER